MTKKKKRYIVLIDSIEPSESWRTNITTADPKKAVSRILFDEYAFHGNDINNVDSVTIYEIANRKIDFDLHKYKDKFEADVKAMEDRAKAREEYDEYLRLKEKFKNK